MLIVVNQLSGVHELPKELKQNLPDPHLLETKLADKMDMEK